MSDFKGRHFGGELILWAVRWYCCYGISHPINRIDELLPWNWQAAKEIQNLEQAA